MIRPQNSPTRTAIDLSGLWHIRFDPDEAGEAAGWTNGLPQDRDTHTIAVPGSWNEQLAEAGFFSYVGTAWLETRFRIPAAFAGQALSLRFGSADYFAEVWIDGRLAGASSAAMLPFEIDGEGLLAAGAEVRLVVRVSNVLPADGPTQGITPQTYQDERRPRDEYHPAVRFDFFPYGGLNRPVHLVARPRVAITGYRATTARNRLRLSVTAGGGAMLVARIEGHGTDLAFEVPVADGRAALDTAVDVLPWSPDDPRLYRLTLSLQSENGELIDRVSQRIGFRDVAVRGTELLLNGEPLLLKGFGKHEDSPIHGRGLNLPQLVKDFGLLKWCGANSVRTSHYPYAEEFLDLADEHGVLVIGEVFSINLDFRLVNDAVLANHKQAARALIERDASRTCVIAWSLANEPGYLAEPQYRERSGPYWAELFAAARALDPTRPLTHANVGYAGNDDPGFAHDDFVMINRYHGWYTQPAQLDRARAALEADFAAIASHGKPILVSEFGADALAGEHATHDQLFTEEYQARFIETYWAAIEAHPAVIGGHVWAFADFRTAQHGRRVVHNLKGVFTRTREPKQAAWTVRRLWVGQGSGP
jgi:beta-glucuronidase